MVSADWPESFDGAVSFVPEVVADERDINQWQRCDARRSGLRPRLAPAGARRGLRQRRRQQKFVNDFIAAWDKVMNLDRFDLAPCTHGLHVP